MAIKKDNLTLGLGCNSCAHNKDINLYKDMYKKATERIESHAEEGKAFINNLKNNAPKRTECRFYNSDDGLLCEYFVERDFDCTGACPDYLEVKFEKASVSRSRVSSEENREPIEGDIKEVDEDEFIGEDEDDDDEPRELDDYEN